MDLMKIDDMAKLLKMSPTTIYRECRKKQIPHFKIGGAIRFDPDEIRDWLEDQKVKPVQHKFR